MAVERVLEPRARSGYCMYCPRAIVQQNVILRFLFCYKRAANEIKETFLPTKLSSYMVYCYVLRCNQQCAKKERMGVQYFLSNEF